MFRPLIYELAFWRGSLNSVSLYQDVRWKNLKKVNLRYDTGLIRTLRFNQKTRWPKVERLPPNFNPGQLLTNAMNPGLGLRELHRDGITGKGVHVAIIDYSIEGEHPEYADQIVEIHRIANAHSPSMHGPAVASLLVGRNCGTAPDAKLHFIVVPDGDTDATYYAEGLEWILKKNASVPSSEKIRIVSISGTPSGRAVWRYRNSARYDEAATRAQTAGLLIVDGTEHRGFVGPCNLDPTEPENPTRCRPILARSKPDYYAGRILAPTGPRTTAEEYYRGTYHYQYCGLQKDTLLSAGSSWSMPYCTGVLALGLQLRPDISAFEMKDLLFRSAHILPDGSKIIDPKSFIAVVKHQ